MIEPLAWMNREFTFDQPVALFAALLERVRGLPARAADLASGFSEGALARRLHGSWSAKEHLGHLVDLQPLDERRLREFLQRARVLSSADIGNRATEIANHSQVPLADIIARLRAGRDT